MCIFRRKKQIPGVELWGLQLRNRVGLRPAERRFLPRHVPDELGFLTLDAPATDLLAWAPGLPAYRDKTLLAVNLRSDIAHAFSLLYDFADILIIDPDSDQGINSPDISDITELLDEITSQRLCYESYTPVLLRLSHAVTPEEIAPLLATCRMMGLDGIVATSLSQVQQILADSQGRVPVVGAATSTEQAQEMLRAGAILTEIPLISPFQLAQLIKNC